MSSEREIVIYDLITSGWMTVLLKKSWKKEISC